MWKRKTETKPLPTNVEHANQDYIREHIASWDKRIVAERAARLGVPSEEAFPREAKPLYLIEAEARAHAEGRSVGSVLDEYRERLVRSTYPGPNCLTPDDVLSCVEGDRLSHLVEHAETCPACRTIVDMARFPPDMPMPYPYEDRVEPIPVASAVPLQSITRWAILNWAAVVLLPVALLLITYLAFWYTDRSASQLTFVHSRIGWIVGAVISIPMYFVFGSSARPVLRRSVTVGFSIATVAIAFFISDYTRSKDLIATRVAPANPNESVSQTTTGSSSATPDKMGTDTNPKGKTNLVFSLADMQVASLCGHLIASVHETGKPPEPKSFDLDFRVDAKPTSGTEATYMLTNPAEKGTVVCDIGPTDGYARWVDGKTTGMSVHLLSGKVHADTSGNRLLLNRDGQSFPLSESVGAPAFQPGDFVVAAADPNADALRPVVRYKNGRLPDITLRKMSPQNSLAPTNELPQKTSPNNELPTKALPDKEPTDK